jgi:hypothetical protein
MSSEQIIFAYAVFVIFMVFMTLVVCGVFVIARAINRQGLQLRETRRQTELLKEIN